MKHNYTVSNQTYMIDLENKAKGYLALVDGVPIEFELISEDRGRLTLRFGDQVKTLYWAAEGDQRWVAYEGCTFLLEKTVPGPARHKTGELNQERFLRAPMPAQVRELSVQAGDIVETGEILIVLEAMKMEIQLRAPRGGKIASVHIAIGDSVEKDQVLVEMEEAQG